MNNLAKSERVMALAYEDAAAPSSGRSGAAVLSPDELFARSHFSTVMQPTHTGLVVAESAEYKCVVAAEVRPWFHLIRS